VIWPSCSNGPMHGSKPWPVSASVRQQARASPRPGPARPCT
jgi:hypothetical protein